MRASQVSCMNFLGNVYVCKVEKLCNVKMLMYYIMSEFSES